jgi:WD40 repeat protein
MIIEELNNINSISYSPDGNYILCGSANGNIKIWSANSNINIINNPIQYIWAHFNGSVNSVAWNPTGDKFVSGSSDRYLKIWGKKEYIGHGYKNLMKLYDYDCHKAITLVAWSPNGTKIVSISKDCNINIWNSNTGECIKKILTRTLRSLSFCPINYNIILVNNKLMNINSGKFIANLKNNTLCEESYNSLEWSFDGNSIVSGMSIDSKYRNRSECEDIETIKIWDVSSLQQKLIAKVGGKKNKKIIDTYKKSELVKIAKMHEISLKTRDDKVKTKLQLFNSLKRKKLL